MENYEIILIDPNSKEYYVYSYKGTIVPQMEDIIPIDENGKGFIVRRRMLPVEPGDKNIMCFGVVVQNISNINLKS